jgi:hypothetical protein
MLQKFHLLFWCLAIGIIAYVCLDFWSMRNAPLPMRLERQWRDDVEQLEASKKLPPGWFDVKDIEVYGGSPETKDWLKQIQVPLSTKKDGHFKLDVLVVAWEEEGKRGTMVQYDLVDLKSGNNIWELGRTLILSRPRDKNPLKALIEDLRL